jgi:NADH-quinone oxidoreductase subunit J
MIKNIGQICILLYVLMFYFVCGIKQIVIYECVLWCVLCSIIIGCVAIITTRNPVHSVFLLLVIFIFGAVVMLIVGAEFLAFMFIIVYVGAIVVFFLFVVMMIDFYVRIPVGLSFFIKLFLSSWIYVSSIVISIQTVGLDLVVELVDKLVYLKGLGSGSSLSGVHIIDSMFSNVSFFDFSNIQQIGNIFYTDFSIIFVFSGLVLFSSIIGCIVLTGEMKVILAKQQNILDQQLKHMDVLTPVIWFEKV